MNSTRLSALCDNVLEMGWLLALIITPLFFNVYSSRVFEPDKLTTLRTVALIMAAVWLVKRIEERTSGRYKVAFTWRTPLVLPTFLTVVVYLISTALSVTLYVSLFGSYQRLQGTYTTLAYIVLFLVILQELRTRAQLDRLITVVILNSLPIALYGLIQHNKLDPLPWGGDVTRRIASNMGNAIFVAAYLIMAALPTLARVVDSFRSILTDEETSTADVLRAAAYIFILLVQVIAIWYTKSRGPLMGLLFGLGTWVLLGLIALQGYAQQGRDPRSRRYWRWLWIGTLATAVLLASLFFAVNPGGPFHESARQQPWIGRLSRVLDHEGGTGKVRSLIWEGGLQMILPHDPIEYPPTRAHPEGHRDPFNALRPLVGYGPESMYVAYNRFYPPLLGHYESRTASPDRSHNETLDSLALTGLLGFVAYLWLFGGVFYFGLRWLGILPDGRRRILFFALLAGGAVAAVVWTSVAIGPHFFGLAIPVGMASGLLVYLIIYGLSMHSEPEVSINTPSHFILLAGILSALVAHFVEINFGIAIASTRTTFWAYAGVLVVAGAGLVRTQGGVKEPQQRNGREAREQRSGRRKRRRRTSHSLPPPSSALPTWLSPTLAVAIVGGFILGTLAFDFITNPERLAQPLTIVWRALTVLPAQQSRTSYGALMIFAVTWLMSAVIFISQMAKSAAFCERKDDWALATVVYLLISLTVGFGFALLQAGRLVSLLRIQPQTLEEVVGPAEGLVGLLTSYCGFIVFVLIAGGVALLLGTRRLPRRTAQPWGVLALVVLAVLAGATAVVTNLQPIQADIVYKQAEQWERGEQWLAAIEHYKRAIELAPKEDFYYLYLGRAYLEYASIIEDPALRDRAMRETEQALAQAREINPLNTDHSANLARMYSRWMNFAPDGEARAALAEKSAANYAIATTLSPQNASLWNEWARLYLYTGDFERAQELVSHSLELDPEFDQSWVAQADLYASQNLITDAIRAYEQALEINPRLTEVWAQLGNIHLGQNHLEEAVTAYEEARELSPKRPQVWRVLGSVYAQLGRLDDATSAYRQALELAPEASDAWDTHRRLAAIYAQLGQNDAALSHAQIALQLAPEEQQPSLQELVAQLQPGSGESQP